MKAIFRIIAGVVLVLVGIVGLMLPIMPQWPFIIPGLMLLAPYFPPAKRLLAWIHRKFPFTNPDSFRKPPSAKMEDQA